tara:strand:+ start:4662 stop:5231 length:570 start_codon:yes stop_codon:yes gene_type:complete
MNLVFLHTNNLIMNIGIIWGSDTGDTEDVTHYIKNKLEKYNVETIEVSSASTEDFLRFDLLMIGLSTWYDGDLQSDWEVYFPTFKEIDFSGKKVAIFGLGDQIVYDEYFVDGIGILAKEVLNNNGEIVGYWPNDDYEFEESKGLLNDELFYGLALDECNQYEMTKDRVDRWLELLNLDTIVVDEEIRTQ